MLLSLLAACSPPPAPPPPPGPPDACTIMRTPAPGPRAAQVLKSLDHPLDVANERIEEARLTGDPGFYTLAEQAIDCQLERTPDDPAALRLRVHVLVQFHQFAEAEDLAHTLVRKTSFWQDQMLLGDALMEQGKLTESAVAYQQAMDQRPCLQLYDRAGWLRWLTGDVKGAIGLQEMAVSAGDTTDPEPYAWVLVRLGWLHALTGAPSPELDAALHLIPGYKPALFARGRVRLAAGDPGAAEDLRAVGPTVEATRALSEIDPAASVDSVATQDPRGFAIWVAPKDPKRALELLSDELLNRQDAVTHMAHAWATSLAGMDGTQEAKDALATGCVEPRVLLEGGLILHDRALLTRALSMGPGLLPSEKAEAQAAVASLPAKR